MANYTILLIDYEPRSIERFREPLVAAGYTIEIATDGVSGIEAFHRLSPDMVLVEAMIPKKHGFEVCQELKRTPHGRRTPVLITTGVYKGRKYRTQALHIYGCDEYIEKPIAPEQLLAVVGKFLKPIASAPSPKATGPVPVPSEPQNDLSADDADRSIENAAPPFEPAAQKSHLKKPTSIPQASSKDDTEDEIMAHLDAVLSHGGGPIPRFAASDSVTAVAAVEQDPFAQMRAELDAELGSFGTALEFEPQLKLEPILEASPSDQAVSPSVLEALPVPEADIPIAPLKAVPPLVTDEPSGQVVNFDTKRPRKSKKAERQLKGRTSQPAPIAPVAEAVELAIPPRKFVESELKPAVVRRGVPVWIWAAFGVVAIGALYFVISPSPLDRSDTESLSAPPTRIVANSLPLTNPPSVATESSVTSAPPAANTPTAATTPPEAPRLDPAPPKNVPEGPKPVLKAPKAPVPKKSPERIPTTVPALTVGAPLKAAAPTPTAPTTAPTNSKHAESQPGRIAAAKTVEPEAPAPPDLDPNVAGVESVADSAAVAPTTTIAPGALIPIDEADVMPVSVSRKLPTYSMVARQMKLSGTVIMNVLVNEHGSVDQVVLVTGVTGGDLNESAMRTAKTWTYRPATKRGVPVKVWKSEQVVFKR